MVKLRPHTRAIASTITLLKVCVIPIDRNRVFTDVCTRVKLLTVVQNTSRYVQTRNLNSNGWHRQISIMSFKSVGRLKSFSSVGSEKNALKSNFLSLCKPLRNESRIIVFLR